jgi:hypothetical protein
MPFCRLPPEPMVGPRARATITDHLPGCVSCARPISDLAAVSAMLANVQAPPIPQFLAERLHAALAGESAQRAALPF